MNEVLVNFFRKKIFYLMKSIDKSIKVCQKQGDQITVKLLEDI
jgi:DNA-binding ferritin-like protein